MLSMIQIPTLKALNLWTVSYTHLDVYKRQLLAVAAVVECFVTPALMGWAGLGPA